MSMRRHAYQNGEAASVHQNLEQLKFVLFQNKSYNYITRLGLNQPEKNDRAQMRRKEKHMKVVLVPGPRNEELIEYVRSLLALDHDSEEWDDACVELYSHIKEADASDMMDALYYASELRDEAVKDQEKYLTWLMTDEEYGYFVDRMVGENN